MADQRGGVLSRTVVSSVGMAVQGLGRFAYTWAVGRFLGPGPLGEVSALLSLAVYAALLWPAGLSVAAARSLATSDEAHRSVRFLRRSFWVGSAVITPGFALAAWLMTRDVASALSTALLVLSYGSYTFTRGVLIGQDRLVPAALWDAVASAVSLTVLVGVLVSGWSWALLLPLTMGYTAFSIAAWPRDPGATSDDAQSRRLAAFARAATWGAIATGGLLPATMVFVRAFDEPAAGYFGAALALATPLNMLAQALNQVLVPHFARRDAEAPGSLAGEHLRLLVITSVGFGLAFGLLILLAPWLITFVFGPAFAPGTAAMQALLLIVAAMSCMSAPSALLMATGRQRTYAAIWIAASAAGLATMAVSSPAFGQWGALAGYALGGVGGAVAVVVASLLPRPPVQPTDPPEEHA